MVARFQTSTQRANEWYDGMMRRTIPLVVALLTFAVMGADKKKDHDVAIDGLEFKPAKLTVKVGQKVTWTNNDDRDHTVECKDAGMKSGVIHRGDTFSFIFDKAGKYHYKCRLHPRMKGEIDVEK